MRKRGNIIVVMAMALFLSITTVGWCLSLNQLAAGVGGQPSDGPVGSASAPNSQGAVYSGYSKQFQVMKENLVNGKTKEIGDAFNAEDLKLREGCESDTAFRDKVGLLGYMERGSMALTLGNNDNCLDFIGKGEEILEERTRESISKENLAKVGSVATEIVGFGDQGRYFGNGFERVMMLNLKSMAYLLNGDLRAYNVARLAITWQDEEKDKFQNIIDENLKQQAEEDSKQDNKDTATTDAPQAGQKSGIASQTPLFRAIQKEFAKYDAKALTVPSAYVNPFGDYLAGVIQEFRSMKDPSLKSNALISYQKALTLNPNSDVIKTAVAALGGTSPAAVEESSKAKNAKAVRKEASPKTEGLLHVIALDGLVPEKKTLPLSVGAPQSSITIKVPVYDNVPNRVASIKITTPTGTSLGELTTVADMEALCFRHQKDSTPLMYTAIMASGFRDILLQQGLKKLGALGQVVGKKVNEQLNPDTRSWMSLPSSVKAARILPPVGLKEIAISVYDNQGKLVSSRTVQLNGTSNNFVIIRSVDKALYVNVSKPIALN